VGTRIVALACSSTLAGAALLSQRQFSAGTDLVRVDVSVLDRNRQPVRGLTAADFTVLEDGRPALISAFSEIHLPDPETVSTPWMRDVAPDVRRNDDVSERRLTVLLMDDATMPAIEAQMIESAKSIGRSIVDRLGPQDLLAVVFTRDNRATQNFTADRVRLHRAIAAFHPSGHDPRVLLRPEPEPMAEMGYFYSSLGVLREVIDVLAAIPERRKSLVYVSTGVPIDMEAARRPSSPHADFLGTFKELFRRADRASVNVYVVDPGGLGGLRFVLERELSRGGQRVETLMALQDRINAMAANYLDFAKSLADNTGGYAFVNTNEFDSRVNQMFRETASFYLLGYATTNPRADGRFRRIQVRVNRRDVTLRARQGYYAPDPQPAKPIVAPPATVQAIAGLLPKSDLPLQVMATPIAVPGQRTPAVVVGIGLRAPEAALAAGDDTVNMLVTAYTPEGDRRAAESLKGTVALDRIRESGGTYEFLSRLNLAPGRYELRVSVSSALQKLSGSVYVDVDVPDFQSAPLSISGAVLGAAPAVPVAPRGLFASLIPVVPTVRRVFSNADEVSGVVTIHQGAGRALLPAACTVRVIDGNGKVVSESPETFSVEDFGASRSVSHEFDVPIDQLTIGSYLLSIEVAAAKATARRDVRFEIR
jgi:VWFA-related protein